MTRQETLKAIAEITETMKGSMPMLERQCLHAERKELRKSLAGWLEGDPAPELQEF